MGRYPYLWDIFGPPRGALREMVGPPKIINKKAFKPFGVNNL
jgi:hypothetical protein